MALPSASTGTLVKEGDNALTKVDLSMHCDKGHGTWSCVPSYQLTVRITEEGLEGLERPRFRINQSESEGKANGQCMFIQMCAIQIPLS